MRMVIGGDLVPTPSNHFLFSDKRVRELIGEELETLFQSADYVCFNLEVPLIETENPIPKSGPNLKAACSAAQGIRALGCNVLTLANNHIMDHGQSGLASTIRALDSVEIAHLGAGKDLKTASQPVLLRKNGITVGIYACAEHEFSIASSDKPGANPFDPLESLDHIVELKAKCDYLIVLHHGGKEHYRYPSPCLQRVCRKMVAKGADLVITQHSHCIGSMEVYRGSTIVYGQGNFLFDYDDNEYWNTGILVQVDLCLNRRSVEYIPLCKMGNVVRRADNKRAEQILSEFYSRSEEITHVETIHSHYNAFSNAKLTEYLQAFHGKHLMGLVFRILNRLSGRRLRRYLMHALYGQKELLVLENFIACEAHRELVLCALSNANGSRCHSAEDDQGNAPVFMIPAIEPQKK